MLASRLHVAQQLAVVVFLAVLLASAAIAVSLFWISQTRSYTDTLRRSEEMVQAASLALSQALAARDDVLLDALLYELQARPELHIRNAYVIDENGTVRAHSRVEQYGRTLPLPALLEQTEPARLSEVVPREGGYDVVTLLQQRGEPIGAAVFSFGTGYLAAQLRAELGWLLAATVPPLLIAGLSVAIYGRRMARRLNALKSKAQAIGRGDWSHALAASGRDEIAELTRALEKMQADLRQLREKDQEAAQTIGNLNQELRDQLRKVQELKEQLLEENAGLRQELRAGHGPDEIIGSQSGLRTVVEQAEQVAALPVTVLITGESGTGKELIANHLHRRGNRRDAAFITVNCAALPATLIESELFGHERGAFTGASARKKGKFELAHGGTIFLDEIGELPSEAQAKLLRALQEKEIYRVGGGEPVAIDARVIAATNRRLPEEVAAGRFREDLYYRLKVVELHCPPLRERLEDLPALAQHFIEAYARKLGKPVAGVSPSALAVLKSYHWPGNVRELENMIARAVALTTTRVLGPDDFVSLGTPEPPVPAGGRDTDGFAALLAACGLSSRDVREKGWEAVMRACERICLEAALAATGSQKEAAAMLGLTPTKLHRLVKKYGIAGADDRWRKNEFQR